jgi:hypothetical protein
VLVKGFWPGVAVGSLCAVGLAMYFGLAQPRGAGVEAIRRQVSREARGRLRVIGRAVHL